MANAWKIGITGEQSLQAPSSSSQKSRKGNRNRDERKRGKLEWVVPTPFIDSPTKGRGHNKMACAQLWQRTGKGWGEDFERKSVEDLENSHRRLPELEGPHANSQEEEA